MFTKKRQVGFASAGSIFSDVDDVGVDIDVGDVDDDEKEASWLPS